MVAQREMIYYAIPFKAIKEFQKIMICLTKIDVFSQEIRSLTHENNLELYEYIVLNRIPILISNYRNTAS